MQYDQFVRGLTGAKRHDELAPPPLVAEALRRVIADGDILDWVKKALSYGKDHDWLARHRPSVMADAGSYDQIPWDVLHGIIGIITEATELGALLYDAIVNKKPLNTTKLRSESGDVLFYLVLLRLGVGSDLQGAIDDNMKKLMARYPNGFSPERAVNKNTAAEDRLLEVAA